MLREEIGQAVMNVLDPRERRVLVLRYGLGNGHAMTFRDVGKTIGLSGERVRLIEREALQKLRESEIISAAGWGHLGTLGGHQHDLRDGDRRAMRATIFRAPRLLIVGGGYVGLLLGPRSGEATPPG